jgi:GAF domain-containing protein
MTPTRGSIMCRAILDRDIIHITDYQADTNLLPAVKALNHESQLTIPLLRDGVALGAISLNGKRGGFTDSQIELMKTFAEQAVIAISSAETYRALQARTTDLQESLEYQTAISDVLKVISRSTFDLQPVLDTVAETAAKLCDAEMSLINRRDGNLFWAAANYGYPPEVWEYWKATEPFPLDPNIVAVGMRTLLEGRVVHIHDVTAVPGYPPQHITLGKQRTTLGVPLLRSGEVIGNIGLARQRVEPFTDRQIALLENFAAQAVIAIENTRLLTEQREALEQQTATAEILQVINSSPGNPTPVFDAMLDKALRLCGAAFGALRTFDDEALHQVASRNLPPRYAEYWNREVRLHPTNTVLGAAVLEQRTVQIKDMATDESYRAGSSIAIAGVELGGVRTLVHVPLIKDKITLGVLTVFRQEVRLFSDKELALLQNFAAQAVIAMENARLLTEQREALEQQTATSEVLQVINSTPGDLAPVFDAMLEKATRLCEAAFGELWVGADSVRPTALFGVPAAYAEFRASYNYLSGPGSFGALLREGHRVIHVRDLAESEAYRNGDPGRRAMVDLGGARSAVAIPLLADAERRGAIVIYRQEVRPFTEKQIALLRSFAAQAVIAIENARLLTEQREALERQTAVAEVLQVINASPGNLVPVFDAMLEKAMRLCRAASGGLFTYDGERFHTVAALGVPVEAVEFRTKHPPTAHPGSGAAHILRTRRTHQTLDRMGGRLPSRRTGCPSYVRTWWCSNDAQCAASQR